LFTSDDYFRINVIFPPKTYTTRLSFDIGFNLADMIDLFDVGAIWTENAFRENYNISLLANTVQNKF
jgi:hypothetical protein